MLGCTIDVFSSIYMFFFVHFKVERAKAICAFFENIPKYREELQPLLSKKFYLVKS
ncbi:hypothetical protein RHABOEDO_000056 [Candidatus Rhabdochlamydia oedothoracis]|uniref:Uncharacterized protein n=1 Tax=Candidatus Rhabdochlamydia oedothoracis TaxID=2720720 RepID=A0ABX8V343_9BACT|nr:hypothetical protein RHABOEDO_000056 [Candidatus Rhabdochlamydia oedothoracis]